MSYACPSEVLHVGGSWCVGVGVFTAEGQRTPGCAKNFQNKLCGTLRAAPRQLTAVRVNTPPTLMPMPMPKLITHNFF